MELYNIDFHYNITYDIIGGYDCANRGCHDEGICRCFRIDSVDIENVDINSIVLTIYDNIFNVKSTEYKRDVKLNKILFGYDKEADLYFIDRLCRIYKIYEEDAWEPEYGSGYYGDEVYKIKLTKSKSDVLTQKIEELFSIQNLKEKCEFILKEEYGYLLDNIKDKSYQIIEVSISDIIFGQDIYQKKIDKNLDFYLDKNFTLIKGVCLKDNNKWRVIDGYHRLSHTKLNKVKIIGIL